METNTIIGLDIGRGSAVACVMTERPIDLMEFIRKYKPISLKATPAAIEELLKLGSFFAMEPTGTDHRFWQQSLEAAGATVLLCAGSRIRNHARESGITSKGDKEDAATVASYTHLHLGQGNLKAFQSNAGNQVQDFRRGLLSAQRTRTRIINQLKARLSYEASELCKFKATDRAWGKDCPKCWHELLEIEQLSWQSREDVEQIIYWEKREQRLELEISALLEQPEFGIYSLLEWGFTEKQIVPIVGALHPVSQFLDADGNRIIERIHTVSGNRVKLDRSLRGVHRCLGYGRLKIQSGDSWRWARTGDRTVLAALYSWLDMKVVVRRTPSALRLSKRWPLPEDFEKLSEKKRKAWIESHNFRSFCLEVEPKCDTVKPIPRDRQRVGYMPWKDEQLITQVCDYSLTSRRVAQLQLFYEWAFFEIGKHDRILKTLPYMIKLLTEDLFEAVQQ